MAKRAAKAAPKRIEPEDESQDIEEQVAIESQEPDESGVKGMTKAEAIRRALAAGHEGPQEGTAYILKEFGIEVAPQHFSATKSQMKSRETSKKYKPGRKSKAAAPSQGVEGYLAPPPKQAPSGGEPDLLEAMEAMKPLVASLGAEKVKRIVDLLG
ncbi:thioesterase [Tautonia marina]|uniref:thioesterase n=1 Tax=Tautonia marina TaxID=2653855 RepID=UPI0012610F55|nr:thioesterase [Tautonia marina]